MEKLTLPEIHEATLEIMDYIHQLCEENHIVYYVAYGSLIGAVRHNGFIPWDDDFDILMPRAEYERFRQVFQAKNHPYFRICERRTTPNYFYGIPRFSDSRYSYHTTQQGIKPFDNGLFIDIYPLDNFCNTYEEAKRLKRKVVRKYMMYEVWLNKDYGQGKLMTFVRGVCHRILRIRYGGNYTDRIDDEIMGIIRKYTSDSDSQIGEACWDPQVVPYRREWFAERVLHDFEGRQYWIPKDYDPVLRADYGDYMVLPPEEKRVPNHSYSITRNESH